MLLTAAGLAIYLCKEQLRSLWVIFRWRFRRFCSQHFSNCLIALGLALLAGAIYNAGSLNTPSVFVFKLGGVSLDLLPLLLPLILSLLLLAIVLAHLSEKRMVFRAMLITGVGMALALALAGHLWVTNVSGLLISQTANSNDFLAHTQNLLNLFGVILATAAIGATVFGFWIQARFEEMAKLEDRLDEASKLAVVTVESALMNLPPPSQSQQVPQAVARTLSVMNRLIFEDPDHALLKWLESHNRAGRFHLAKAVYEYSRGNFSLALRELERTIKRAEEDKEVRLEAIWLQAMLLRQDGRFKKSEKGLQLLLGEAQRRGDGTLKSQATVGFALHFLATRPNP